MDDINAIKKLAARVAGLRQAMEVVMNGTTPDHAKWNGVNSFIRSYSELARMYVSLTGDSAVSIYDADKLPSPSSQVWPALKGHFDTIYLDTVMLLNVLNQVEEPAATGPLYNLFVSGDEKAWSDQPFQLEPLRCVREYTSPKLTNRFGNLSASSIAELKRSPCVFAFESKLKLPPKFGYIRDVTQRQDQVRIEYELHKVEPFLTSDDLEQMSFELDIGKYELYRTHWAVKEINLPKELHAKGITLPSSVTDVSNAVDISIHAFDVALSFPGESRQLVESIARELERRLGPNTYFYDNNYVSQLARPSLDVLLQGIYGRAKLDVVFLSADYQQKKWCGVEFRAIREIIFARENGRVMFVRTDDGEVDGVFKTDGYVDARNFESNRIADFVCERLDIINRNVIS